MNYIQYIEYIKVSDNKNNIKYIIVVISGRRGVWAGGGRD